MEENSESNKSWESRVSRNSSATTDPEIAVSQNVFASRYIKLAEQLARSISRRYKGGPNAVSMDYDACFGAALTGLLEITLKEHASLDQGSDRLRNLCSMSMRRRIADLTRVVVRSKQGDWRPIAQRLDNPTFEGESLKSLVAEPHVPDFNEDIEYIKSRIRPFFLDNQFKIMSDFIDYTLQGYHIEEISVMIGKERRYLNSYVYQLRQKLRDQAPDLEDEIAKILEENRREQKNPQGHQLGR